MPTYLPSTCSCTSMNIRPSSALVLDHLHTESAITKTVTAVQDEQRRRCKLKADSKGDDASFEKQAAGLGWGRMRSAKDWIWLRNRVVHAMRAAAEQVPFQFKPHPVLRLTSKHAVCDELALNAGTLHVESHLIARTNRMLCVHLRSEGHHGGGVARRSGQVFV